MAGRSYDGHARSIPAHAGEPFFSPSRKRTMAVYPRPRGGTVSALRKIASRVGLSPPTRGNPLEYPYAAVGAGSIPAHAGEPLWNGGRGGHAAVYPRPRGGTRSTDFGSSKSAGLSPPTRGNRIAPLSTNRQSGSIPAHAGEPMSLSWSASALRVYPRPRGGTLRPDAGAQLARGLSPPTRGNLPSRPVHSLDARSIPAHAGEPYPHMGGCPPPAVYPRPRGGTGSPTSIQRQIRGLSPPTRGNRRQSNHVRPLGGSIPAHAGEPRSSFRDVAVRRVYPRPRGGTPSRGF